MPYTKERNCGSFPDKEFAPKEWCIKNQCRERCGKCPRFDRVEDRLISLYQQEHESIQAVVKIDKGKNK